MRAGVSELVKGSQRGGDGSLSITPALVSAEPVGLHFLPGEAGACTGIGVETSRLGEEKERLMCHRGSLIAEHKSVI